MAEDPQPQVSPAPLRARDRQRDRVIDQLSTACADGRLALEEFSRRVDVALSASYLAELAPLTADLGEPPPPVMGPPRPGRRSWVLAVMASTRKRGRWKLAPSTRSVAVMGECFLDLREADVEARDSHILAVAVMGTVHVIVPEGIEVDLDGLAIMGTRDLSGEGPAPLPGAPRIRVTAAAVMGEVQVIVAPADRGPVPGEAPPGLPYYTSGSLGRHQRRIERRRGRGW